jgi:hypothetical protein
MKLFLNQPTSVPKLILAGALLIGPSFSSGTTPPGQFYIQEMSGTKTTRTLCARTANDQGESQATICAIQRAAQSPDLDEDETPPLPAVVAEATRIIRQTADLMEDMPEGEVSIFFGELSVTWRAGDKIVRLACFPNRPTLIQYGSLSSPMGSYRSEGTTPDRLAERLCELDNDSI